MTHDKKEMKEIIRIRLSKTWEGDQEAFLYHEAREWISAGWVKDLSDDHYSALASYQRKMLTAKPSTSTEGI